MPGGHIPSAAGDAERPGRCGRGIAGDGPAATVLGGIPVELRDSGWVDPSARTGPHAVVRRLADPARADGLPGRAAREEVVVLHRGQLADRRDRYGGVGVHCRCAAGGVAVRHLPVWTAK